jgi:hypothetical protein
MPTAGIHSLRSSRPAASTSDRGSTGTASGDGAPFEQFAVDVDVAELDVGGANVDRQDLIFARGIAVGAIRKC